jgi:hypothetical protein
METACSAETSLNICQTALRHIPEGFTVHIHGRDVTSLKNKLTVAMGIIWKSEYVVKSCNVFAMWNLLRRYSGVSVHERPCSRTPLFRNKYSEQKTSRMTKTQAGNSGKLRVSARESVAG